MLRHRANPDSVEDSRYAEETEFFPQNSVSLPVLHSLFKPAIDILCVSLYRLRCLCLNLEIAYL